jgi:predicted GNAT family acetyltransferase
MPQIPLDIWDAIQTANRYSSGGVPFAERDVKDVARVGIELAGTGYTKGLLSGAPPIGTFAQSSWHGGPNKWAPEPDFPQGRPRLDKMGTGEGAQAYGWGFYSADKPGTAKKYQDALSHNVVSGVVPEKYGVDAPTANRLAEKWLVYKHQANDDDIKWMRETMDPSKPQDAVALDVFDGKITRGIEGQLYHLDLPDEDVAKYLDWDAPLSEQSESVRAALEKTNPVRIENGTAYIGNESLGAASPGDELNFWAGMQKSGESMYRAIEKAHGSKQAASEALRRAGIPGLKYFDQMSRGPQGFGGSAVGYKVVLPDGTDVGGKATAGGDAFNLRQAETVLTNLKNQYPDAKIETVGRSRNYVTWDQDVLDRVKILERDGETFLPTVDSSIHGNTLTIHKIETPPDMRGTGKAEQALTDVLRQADEQGLQVVLTPSNAFGAARGRLEKWYRRHGFVPNKGRNKDFSTRESMIRRARSLPNTLSSSGPPLGLLQGAQTAWDQFTGDRS